MKSAACLPETCFTVWTNVFMRGGLKAGERFLVHGGSSGIGTTAIQLARVFGARVFATAGPSEKCAACTSSGGRAGDQLSRRRISSRCCAAEGGADLILDMVGGDYIPRNVKALADDGRLVQIAFLSRAEGGGEFRRSDGAPADDHRVHAAPAKRSGQGADRRGSARDRSGRCWKAGRIAPVMDSEFPLADAARAHARMESSDHIGKIVLAVG